MFIVRLGKRDDPLLMIYARQIIERISLVSDKPLLLSISLKSDEASRNNVSFQNILNKLFEIATW